MSPLTEEMSTFQLEGVQMTPGGGKEKDQNPPVNNICDNNDASPIFKSGRQICVYFRDLLRKHLGTQYNAKEHFVVDCDSDSVGDRSLPSSTAKRASCQLTSS